MIYFFSKAYTHYCCDPSTPVHKNKLLVVTPTHPLKRTYFMDGPIANQSKITNFDDIDNPAKICEVFTSRSCSFLECSFRFMSAIYRPDESGQKNFRPLVSISNLPLLKMSWS